ATGTVTILDTDENNNVVCTFTNTRRTATLQLTKDWVDSPATDDGVTLRIGPAGAPLATVATTSNTAPATPISTVVYVGDTYEIAEDALATFDAANYDIDWSCTDAAGSSGSDETTGSVAVTPADAGATILCTFSNDRLSTPLSFRKEWIDGAEGDTADLTIDPEIVDPATATWAVPVGAEPVGTGSGTTSDSYTVTVYAGEDVVLSELLADGNLGGYTVADFDCGDVVPTVGSGTWTVSVDENNTDNAIECVITNQRTETTLTLVKDWVDPTTGLGSSVEMTATGQGGQITEPSTSPTDSTSDTLRVFSGETVDISEVFTTGDGANFSTVLTCLPAVEANVATDERSADVVVPTTGLEPIECTFENTRLNTSMTLDKDWINPVEGDRYGLQISGTGNGNGISTAPAATLDTPVSGAGSASLQVYAGEQVTVTEFALANTGTYTVAGLDCGALTATPVGDGPAATLTLSAADVAAPINCTYTNARTSADFTIAKTWDDPVGGVGIGLTASGTDPLSGSVAESLQSPTEGSFGITVYSGETVSFGETFDVPADADLFTTTLVCDGDAADNTTPYAGSYEVPADPQDTTCTFDNVRKRTQLVFEKRWVGAVADDLAALSVSATNDDGPVNAIAPDGSGTSADTAEIEVYAGETVSLSETIDPLVGTPDENVALYDVTAFDCSAGDVTWAGGITDDDATVAVDGDDVASPISCWVTNTARRGTIVVTKTVDGPDAEFDFTGDWLDAVDFSIDTAVDDTVTFADVLVPKDGFPYLVTEVDYAPTYGTTVVCLDNDPDGTASSPSSPTAGRVGTIYLDTGETVSCTFNNTQNGTVTIIKDTVFDGAEINLDSVFDFLGDIDGNFQLDNDGDELNALKSTVTFENVVPGAYAVTEVVPAGWDLTGLVCVDSDETGTDSTGSLETATATINVDAAESIICTFTNTALGSDVQVTKQVEGIGSAQAWSFAISIDGDGTTPTPVAAELSPATGTGEGSDTLAWTNLQPGATYVVSEADTAGWTAGVMVCSDLDGVLDDLDDLDETFTFVAPLGDANDPTVTYEIGCEITNTAIPSDVSVAKTVAGVADTLDWAFDFTISGVSDDADVPVLDSADTTSEGTGSTTSLDTVDWSGLTPGATYVVGEVVPNTGYVSGTMVCSGVTDLDDVDETVTFVAPLGGEGVEITCDITNTAIPSEVSVTKTVDGGLDAEQAWAFEFTLTPDATPIGSQTATSTGDGSDTVTWTGLVPGETYIVTEVLPGTNPTTYENGDLTCSIGDADGQTATFVAPLGNDGVEVACTVTNTAQSDVSYDKALTGEPVRNADGTWSLSYTLTVSNAADAGAGSYDLSDTFLFDESVTIVTDSADVVNDEPGDITTNDAFDGVGDPVIVTGQPIAAGATHTYFVTVDVTIAVGPDTDGDCVREDEGGTGFLNQMSITIDGGEPETTDACAGFATLTLVKNVVNEPNGGNATVVDFPLTAEGPVTLTGISGTEDVSSAVPAGSYTLSEDQLVEGYLPSLFLCEGGSGTVTLVDGDNATCTITNVAQPVDLAITKNDDGITAIAGGAPFDYTITVQNVGTRDADLGEDITVVDELPLPLQWVSFPDNCEQAGQTLTCDIDPTLMTVGADPVVITVTVRAPADAASGTYVNHVSVTTLDDAVCEPFGDCEPPPCEEAVNNNNVDCEPTPVDREGA
ncbi:MAG: hypothetical protein KDB37_07425, partial [Ilumatobacter sp.]|nr:hypothetical protein [Ilumatobacter sp.]